jgi:hypothetical protein
MSMSEGGTMNTVYFNPTFSESERRNLIYAGQIMVLAPTLSSLALCDFAKTLLVEAFGGADPRTVHDFLPVEKYAEILSQVKPKFIHHPESKRLLRNIALETGHDLEKTYLDTPRMRSAAPSDYLRYGIAYAFHPHRDTWYSAPFTQINWWMPIYEFASGNSMAFHPKYWNTPLRNGSGSYNYQDWNDGPRQNAAAHIKSDTREQPKAEEEVEMEPQLRLVCPVGAMILFSGAQLHSTVPNQTPITRFSIDFRCVNIDDVTSGHGAPNIDSTSTGTAMVDYMRGSDMASMPKEVLHKHLAPRHRGMV